MKLKLITQALQKIRHVWVNRKYKDHLFRFVFQNKNDVSFLIGNYMNLYASKQVTLPTPKYVIFYNGTQNEPERLELRLSDAFEEKDQEAALECRALMLNINYGHNKELMKKCKRLEDYAYFIQSVRKYLADGNSLEKAAELAISECIEKNILADILRQNRAEVLNLLLTVYDKKLHEKTLREEGREEGRAEERERSLKALAQERERSCQILVQAYCKMGFSKTDTLHSLMENYELEQSEAEIYVNEVWESKL